MDIRRVVAIYLGAVAACILILWALISLAPKPQSPLTVKNIEPTATLVVGPTTFRAAVASTPDQKQSGLSGVTTLRSDEAMYFPFDGQSNVSFWMKDMVIPIDILWVEDGKVVQIDDNIQPPTPGTPDVNLKRYPSPTNSLDAVIEIGAGQSSRLKLTTGSTVSFQP